MMHFSIIIINWNTRDTLNQCLQSLYLTCGNNLSFEVIVVDNASSDLSAEMVNDFYPDVTLLRMETNLGFAVANNIAIKYVLNRSVVSDYILFLNSDVILSNGSIDTLLGTLEEDKELAAAGPALLLPDNTYQIGAAGFRVSAYSGFIYFSLLFKILPRHLTRGLFIDQKKYANASNAVFVGWLAGACFMVRTSVLRQVGGWDEAHFMYAEDIELCDRITDAGWKVVYLPYVKVIHYHGASSKGTGKPNTMWIAALLAYVRNKRSFTEYVFFRVFAIGGALIRLCCYGAMFILTSRDSWRNKTRELAYYTKAVITERPHL